MSEPCENRDLGLGVVVEQAGVLGGDVVLGSCLLVRREQLGGVELLRELHVDEFAAVERSLNRVVPAQDGERDSVPVDRVLVRVSR